MATIYLTDSILNNQCKYCGNELYEGDPCFTFTETLNTCLQLLYCSKDCLNTSCNYYPFLKKYNCINTFSNYIPHYTSNMFKLISSDIYNIKILMYDCSLNSLNILNYISNINEKSHKTKWEKKFIKNCLLYNFIKIEKII